jgi:hypothetical protein
MCLPVFTLSNERLLILEKVWAKIHGSYDKIVRKALRELTGAPTRWLDKSVPDLWNAIIKGKKENWNMCCSSESENA